MGRCDWNWAGGRFPGVRQRVDFYPVSQPLWAVAHTIHPQDEAAARAWVEPLLAKLKADASCEVITELEQLQGRLAANQAQAMQKEVAYFQSHRERMGHGRARKKGEPLGTGAKESTCR